MKKLFLEQAGENQVFPIGAGIWLRIHPEDVITSPYRSKEFDETTTQMPEFTTSGLGKKSNTVTTRTECGENASGVLYALVGSGGGLTFCMDDGYLVFEYNDIIVQGFVAKSEKKFSAGKRAIVVDTTPTAPRPGSPADIVLTIDGEEVARTAVAMTTLAAFTASESFNVGIDLGSTVFRDYFQRRPCRFNDKIKSVRMVLKETPCFLTACSIPTFLEPI